jgi:hypothetical protein
MWFMHFFKTNGLVNLKLTKDLCLKLFELININSMYYVYSKLLKFDVMWKTLIYHLNKIKDQYNTNCKIINTVLWIQAI